MEYLAVAVGAIGIFVLVFVLMGKPHSNSEDMLSRIGELSADDISKNITEGGGLGQYETLLFQHAAKGLDLRDTLQNTVGKQLDKTERGVKMIDQLQKADLKLRPAEWSAIVSGICFVVGVLGAIRFGNVIFFFPVAGLTWFGTRIYLKRRISKRKAKFDEQLGPTVLSLSNGVKAGYTLAQAMSLVAQNAPQPMGAELNRVNRESQLGIPFIEAFGRMVERCESEDLKLMLTAVQIQQQVGGNLATILDSIEFTIRERVRIKGEIKTITGQARASGWVLILLPGVLSGLLFLIAPQYFDPMFQQLMGQIMLGIALFMIAGGYAIIRKIVQVEV